jgi:hypothetical protein
MTCAHVLGLIDAGSLADYPGAHLDTAWQHARQCATCGPALEAATALTTDLARLPQPAPPAELARTVLARLARIEAAQSASAATVTQETRGRSDTHDWSPWATSLGSLAAGFAIVLSMPPGGGALIDITSPRVGVAAGVVAMHVTSTWTLVLAASLGLYVVGLFAPLRGKGRRY